MSLFWGDDDRDRRRSFGTRDKEILWERAHHKCENCHKRLDFTKAEFAHKKAWSKGGSTTYRNAVVLCAECNRLMGTDDWATFQRKQGRAPARSKPKKKRKKDTGLFGDFTLGWDR